MLLDSAVPQRFVSEVSRHLFLNYIDRSGYPLILGIFGRPGEGKTYQLRRLLTDASVDQYSVSAADLESDRAGQPGKLILSEYVKAARSIESGNPAAVVIDDIDTTIGEWAQNTGTVNHQQVLAQLMHLADRPASIERIGIVRRVPVFVTGNDPSKLYSPLRRPGRMYVMHWQPTADELRLMSSKIFENILSNQQLNWLLRRHSQQPIAFFAQLRVEILRHVASTVIARSVLDLPAVIRDPQRYDRLLDASAASTRDHLFAIACDEAIKLENATKAGQRSYLQNGTVRNRKAGNRVLRQSRNYY